jgi:hypothetical protein
MKRAISILVGVGLLELASASSPTRTSTPQVTDVVQHLLGTLCGELLSEVHFATDDRIRQLTARRYYGTLFLVWFATQDRPGGKVLDLDIRDYVRGFLRAADKEHFAALINYDDPLSWSRLPAGTDPQRFIDLIGGMPYYTWVLEQTKEPDVYRAAVQRFHAFTATVHKND